MKRMMMILYLVIFCSMFCCMVIPAEASHIDKIAISSNRSGNYEIYTMNPTGFGLLRLTNNPAEDRYPSWSPDGLRLAFSSERDGISEIYVMNNDGTGQTRITPIENGVSNMQPSWSPDGSAIVYISVDKSSQTPEAPVSIYTIHPDGTGLTRLLTYDITALLRYPSWSPDSSRIVFNSKYNLYIMNRDGTGITRIPTTKPSMYVADWMPDWSSDGSTIVYSTSYSGISTIHPDGTAQTLLTSRLEDNKPTWSPNDTRIAFSSFMGGSNFQIYAMNADGSGLTRLTYQRQGFDIEPDWGVIYVPHPPIARIHRVQPVPRNAQVVLDGSGSGDSDGFIVAYSWSFGDGISASGKTVSHTYRSDGTYTMTLTVTDNEGLTGTDTMVITIRTPIGMTEDLKARIAELGLPTEIRKEMTETLNQAEARILVGNYRAARQSLSAFIDEVRSAGRSSLTSAQARELVTMAQRIISILPVR